MHRARQFDAAWFDDLDLVIALDQGHARDLWRLAPENDQRAKVRLLQSFLPTPPASLDVADPYYDGVAAFERVLDQVERAGAALLDRLAPIIEAGGRAAT